MGMHPDLYNEAKRETASVSHHLERALRAMEAGKGLNPAEERALGALTDAQMALHDAEKVFRDFPRAYSRPAPVSLLPEAPALPEEET